MDSKYIKRRVQSTLRTTKIPRIRLILEKISRKKMKMKK